MLSCVYVGERGVKNAEEVAFASTSASVEFAKNAKVRFIFVSVFLYPPTLCCTRVVATD